MFDQQSKARKEQKNTAVAGKKAKSTDANGLKAGVEVKVKVKK